MADGLIDAARSRLAPYGISMEILCRCERYALIFVYREEMLGRAFTPEAECFLEGYGYAAGSSVAEKLAVLKSRLTICGEFPHEIGVFLDYPLEDVRGFIENGGGTAARPAAHGRSMVTGREPWLSLNAIKSARIISAKR